MESPNDKSFTSKSSVEEKPFSSYTVSELRRICKDNDIECAPQMKKSEIVDLLNETDEIIIKPKGKGKSKGKVIVMKSKPSIMAHMASLSEDMASYGTMTAYNKSQKREDLLTRMKDKFENFDWSISDKKFKNKVEAFIERLEKESDLSEDIIDEGPEEPVRSGSVEGKPSISDRIPNVKHTYARFTTTTNPNIKRANLRDLKMFLEVYDWSGQEELRKNIEATILGIGTPSPVPSIAKFIKPRPPGPAPKIGYISPPISPPSFPTSFPPSSPPKRKILPSQKYVPGIYRSVDIGSSIKFIKNDDKQTEVPKLKITITLTEFREEIKKPSFIKAFANSSRELMKAKEMVYLKRLMETKKEYDSMRMKVFRLKTLGTSDSTIRELYPGYDTMGAYIIDIENVIELVKKKADTITELEISDGLEEALEDPDDGIAALMGRTEIKDQLASQLYSFSKGYKTFFGNFNNIVITGPAGSGKTRLAKTIAFAFSKVGILARGVVKIVTRTELVGQYIGHTAPRTRGALLETLEGVLFIDEAYQLTPCPEDRTGSKDFGSEAITEMVNFLDKYIGLNIVIVAGYEGVMNRCFMTANEGLPRRFPYRYILSAYTVPELTDILVYNLKRKVRDDVSIDDDTGNLLYSVVNKLFMELPDVFRNQAGDMLNLSSNLNNSINSSYRVQWKNGNLEGNKKILLSGFDDFLESKGYHIDFEDKE